MPTDAAPIYNFTFFVWKGRGKQSVLFVNPISITNVLLQLMCNFLSLICFLILPHIFYTPSVPLCWRGRWGLARIRMLLINEWTNNYLLNALTQIWVWNCFRINLGHMCNINTYICKRHDAWISICVSENLSLFNTNLVTRKKTHCQVYLTFLTILLKINL